MLYRIYRCLIFTPITVIHAPRLRSSLDSIYKYLSFSHNRKSIKTYVVAFSIIAAITTLQLTSTIFLGLSSSTTFSSKTSDAASSTDTIKARSTAAGSTPPYTKIIPSAVAQEEAGDAGEGEGSDEFTSEPEGGGQEGEDVVGGEGDVPVEGGDTGAELVEPTTTTTTTTTELKCDDGIDDDADGLIDLQDTQDCPFQAPLPSTSTSTNASSTENLSMQAAEEQMPPTSEFVSPQALQQQEEFCGDNVDNNGNGQIDEGCPDLRAETPTATPLPSPSPTPCPPGLEREPDTNECAPIPGVLTPSPSPSPVPSPKQQPILPPLTLSQPEGNELGTAGPAIETPTPSPSPPPLTDVTSPEVPSPTPSLTPCPTGQDREPDTMECAPIPPTPCPLGQDREPDTGDCLPLPTLTPSPSPLTTTPTTPSSGGCQFRDPTTGECIGQTAQSAGAAGGRPPQLNVKVVVINDNRVGSLFPPNFQVHVIGESPSFPAYLRDNPGVAGHSPASFRVYSPDGVDIVLSPGQFEVTIDDLEPSRYTHAALGTCSGRIYEGDSLNCTFVKDDRPRPITGLKVDEARLIVRTEIRNDDGATLDAGETTVRINGNHPAPNIFLGNSRPEGTVVRLLPGQYSVDAGDVAPIQITAAPRASPPPSAAHGCSVPPCSRAEPVVPLTSAGSASAPPTRPNTGHIVPQFGYLRAYSSECSGNILAGETKVCNVFLDDAPRYSSRLLVAYSIEDPNIFSQFCIDGDRRRCGLLVYFHRPNGGSLNIMTVQHNSDERMIGIEPGARYHVSVRCLPNYRACEDALGADLRIVFRGDGCRIMDYADGFFSRGGNMLAGETKRCDVQVYPGRS